MYYRANQQCLCLYFQHSVSLSSLVSGLALAGYATAIGFGAVALSSPVSSYVEALQAAHVNPALLFLGKLILAFPFTFHFFNGIRHLVWDLGQCLSIKGVYATGYLMLGASGVSALALACM